MTHNRPKRTLCMATLRFDQGHRFDAGLRFDSESPPPVSPPGNTKGNPMANIKLDLQNKTVDQKITLGSNHITSMDGNANYPTAMRSPSDAQFQTAQDELVAANGAAEAAETAWRAALLLRDAKEAAWDTSISARAANCESITPRNRALLQTTGLPLRSLPSPIGIPNAPINLLATQAKNSGELIINWSRVRGATSYIVERMVHDNNGTWQQVKLLSQSKFTDTGLTPGVTYAYRVRALATAGAGPWSDETVRMAQ